jgi:hypothetical protein
VVYTARLFASFFIGLGGQFFQCDQRENATLERAVDSEKAAMRRRRLRTDNEDLSVRLAISLFRERVLI